MKAPAPRRVAAVGVDAADWGVLESLIERGRLPVLSDLRRRGAFAQLDYPDHRTGLAWEHFLTGRDAAANGRWSAVEYDPATYEVWQEGARPVEPFFASDPPLETVCFDVPYATLATPGLATVVTDWGSHDPGYPRASRPPGLLSEIDEAFGPHPACQNCYGVVWHRPEGVDALADGLVEGAARRSRVTRWLMERCPEWDLFLTVMSEPHSAAEQFWHGIDPTHPVGGAPSATVAGRRLHDVYEAVDTALGEIVDALPADTHLVVFSLGGMTRNDADVASMVLLPELFHRLHFGEPLLRTDRPEWAGAGHPVLLMDPAEDWTGWLRARFGEGTPVAAHPRRARALRRLVSRPAKAVVRGLRSGRDAVPEHALVRGVQGNWIPRESDEVPSDGRPPRSDVGWQVTAWYRRHWTRMRFFAVPTFYDGRIRVNLEGRERDGIVPLDRYGAVCDEIEEVVSKCRNPRTGEPAVDSVVRLRADDPLAPGGAEADLQVVWREDLDAVDHPDVGLIGPVPYRRTGGHSPNGFAVVIGPGIVPSDLGRASAHDVAPTILRLAGRIPDPSLQGSSLVDTELAR